MAEQATSALAESGQIEIVERSNLDDVVKESAFSGSGSVVGGPVAGRLLNVDFLIVVALQDLSGPGGGAEKGAIKFRGIRLRNKKAATKVTLMLRMVEVETGVVVSSHQATGTARVARFKIDDRTSGAVTDRQLASARKAGAEAIDELVAKVHEVLKLSPFRGTVVRFAGDNQVS